MLKSLTACICILGVATAFGAGNNGPKLLPADAPKLDSDKIFYVTGSSNTEARFGCPDLPAWTGGENRVPPQCDNGQNVFFRVFEILNDHENMRWRRLPDSDWKREGEWKEMRFGIKCSPNRKAMRVLWVSYDPKAAAELKIPAGFEKIDLIFGEYPNGDTIKVLIDGKAPSENAVVDTVQTGLVPRPRKDGKPGKYTGVADLRKRYKLDPAKAHVFCVEKATPNPKKPVGLWGAVYWRGNCIQVIQRAKSSYNVGQLPSRWAKRRFAAHKPDYVLSEAINIRNSVTEGEGSVKGTLYRGFNYLVEKQKKQGYKVMVFTTPQGTSKAFRDHFRKSFTKRMEATKNDASRKFCQDRIKAVSEENAAACQKWIADYCKTANWPLIDAGPYVDAWMKKNPSATFVPHIFNGWHHPKWHGAALTGQTIYDGITKHWPELPIRSMNMPPPLDYMKN